MLEGFVPFPPEFAERYRAKGYWEDRSLGSAFDEVCLRNADRTAIVAGAERITYRQVAERAERLALHLVKMGLAPLDRVVVQMPNAPEFIYLYLALQKVGAIPITALPGHRSIEINHFVTLSEAAGYVFPEKIGDFSCIELAQRLEKECPSLRHLIVYGDRAPEGTASLKEMLQQDSGLPREALARIRIDPTLPAVLQLSGGTTGVPKLIPRTHNDYLYNSRASAAVNDIHPDDALLIVVPVAHNFPLACPGMQGFFLHGARVVLSPSNRPEDVFPIIAQERITHVELVPAVLIRWINDPLLQQFDLSSLRVINSGGQRLQPEVKRRTETLLPGCKVQEVFGMAEGLLVYVRLDDPDEERMETAGRPVSADDEIMLVDDDGRPVPPGEVGELLVRGPYTLRGYFRAPEHNARAFTPDGFYKTGDLMRQTPFGNLVVAGRKKDLINRGGEKISAEEIENLILSHPAVQNVACVPMPDPVLGERTCAYIVVKPDCVLTLEELQRYLVNRGLAKFKLPERLEIVDDFPRSAVGKVSKAMLVKQIAETVKTEQAARDPRA